jgi:predicted RNA-binding protein YlqC (UPF0109 family)
VSSCCKVADQFFYVVYYKEVDGQDEIRMLVHQNLAGRIIGKQGVKVKELKEVCVNAGFLCSR